MGVCFFDEPSDRLGVGDIRGDENGLTSFCIGGV